ncbi:anaphase-promoting complex subunit 5-like [Galendromus occidentalis]|uniref:Anaphase-promoting complex subunit 5 n=1 Tax=Galendromus occidentalis TaxID=34638 RepID=A0AAJ6VU69_9ACAR|nr:anaphase-promoting complex subunit 5-like [Galendromus occidentalis]
MENAFILSDVFRQDFTLTAQSFTIGLIFLEYSRIRSLRYPVPGFTGNRHRETTFLFLKLVSMTEIPHEDLMSIVRRVMEPVVAHRIAYEVRALRANPTNQVMNIAQRMDDFLQNPETNQTTTFNRRSLVGRFMRKVVLSLKAADFGLTVRFAQYLIENFDETSRGESSDEGPARGLPTTFHDISFATNFPEEANRSGSKCWGRKRARAYLNAQAINLRDNPGTMVSPKQLDDDLQAILADDPELTDAYYLASLNQMLCGEYNGALESCHNFFLSTKKYSAFKFRYALLNIGIIQRKFNHIREAELALKECISLCQQVGDTQTLAEATNWLKCTNDESSFQDAYSRSHKPPGEFMMYSSKYSNKLERFPVSADSPRLSVERLDQRRATTSSGPCSMIAHNFEELLLWIGYGFHENAKLHGEMILYISRGRFAHQLKDWVVLSESTLFPLIFFARHAMADYDCLRARKFIEIATYVVPEHGELRDMVDLGLLCLKCEEALRLERYESCKEFVGSMGIISQSQAQLYNARMCFQKGSYQQALRIIEHSDPEADDDMLRLTKGLLKARVLAEVGSDQVNQCILGCLAECERFQLKYLGAMLRLEVAKYHKRVGSPHGIIESIMRAVAPLIMSHGTAEDKLHFRKIEAEVAEDPRESVELMAACYEEWKHRDDVYNQRLALDYLARKCHELGDISKRNIFSSLFRNLVTTEGLH